MHSSLWILQVPKTLRFEWWSECWALTSFPMLVGLPCVKGHFKTQNIWSCLFRLTQDSRSKTKQCWSLPKSSGDIWLMILGSIKWFLFCLWRQFLKRRTFLPGSTKKLICNFWGAIFRGIVNQQYQSTKHDLMMPNNWLGIIKILTRLTSHSVKSSI